MTVYTSSIPQPQDDPSDSQDQILQNFQTLNSAYGSSGDHYPWTNTAVATTRKHAKVTLPGLPTAGSPPGDVLPGPLAGNCAIFAQTRDNQTTPFVSRDGLAPTAPLTNIWPLMPIKAFATFTTVTTGPGPEVQTINQQFNVTSISRTGNTYTVTMSNAMRTTDYGVLVLKGGVGGLTTSYTIVNTTTFTFSPAADNNVKCTVVVLEP